MPVVKADSGIAIDASPASTKGGDVASDRTQSDSRPASPVIASSEAEQSTKASSVSESTDHTVEAAESKAVDEEASSNGSTPKPTQGQDQSASPVDGPTAPQTNGTEAESDAEKTDDVSVSKQEEPTVTPAAFTTEQEAVAEDKVLEEQNEAVAVPVSDAATDIPVPATSAPVSEPEENKPETQEILETMHPPPTTDVSEAPSSQLPNTTAEEPSEQITLEERPQILPRATEADESDTETVLAPPKKQLSTRRKLVEPIRTDLAQQSRPTSQSEFNFSDNESLLEELQSATVEEAKPMTVSKTPLTPVFPGKLSAMGGPSSPNKPHVVRTVSNPVRGSTLVAPPTDVSQSSARSLSQGAAYLHQVTQQRNGDPNLAKRTNMGSGISQRIKALELLSANSAETASQPGSRPSSTFFSVKKDRVPSRSPSVVDRTNSFTRPSTAQSRDHSPETSKFHRDRSGSISSRLSMFEPTGSPSNTPRGRPETISVTAKIIRDSLSKSRNPSDQGPLELKQSPLLVDHQRATDTPEVVEPTGDTTERRTSMSHDRGDTSSRRSSFSIVRDFIKEGRKSLSSPSTDNLAAPNHSINNGARSPTRPPSTHQNSSSFAGRLSIGGSRRSFSKDRDVSSILSDDGADDSKSTSDKRMSRAGRLMRRLSSLSGSSRSKITSPTGGTPTVAEEILPDTTANLPSSSAGTTASSPSVAAYMGDVNVQFPDTLLWKRRNMYLDSQGFVVLSSLPQQSQSQRTTGIKRFHLGDFKTPYAPDVEVQELPNSVVLDLVEGSAVQVACEDRAGQMHVLQSKSPSPPW